MKEVADLIQFQMRDEGALVTFEIPEVGALRSCIQQVSEDVRGSHAKLGSFKPRLAVPRLTRKQHILLFVFQVGQRQKAQHPLFVFEKDKVGGILEVLLKAVTELPEVRDISTYHELIPESPARLQVGHHFFPDHTLFPDSARTWKRQTTILGKSGLIL
jgi:hypothetical protein